jgi:hypothetical protein
MRSLLGPTLALVLASCASSTPQPVTRPAPPPAVAPVVKPDPAEMERLNAEGFAAYERKEWVVCADKLERAEKWYDAACCRAQAGQIDPAFALLDRAIGNGFRDAKHLENDPDLKPLHGDPRWARAFESIKTQVAAYRASVNGELLDLFEADQGDRTGGHGAIDWKVVGPRDEARRKRVDEIVAAGGAKVADDYYHAAMVYQHGSTILEIKRANELALKAVALDGDHPRARWLAAASEDRALMYDKKPQKYGTQFHKQGDVWELWEVDPAITDEERAKWNVPPLAAAKARAVQMNARK